MALKKETSVTKIEWVEGGFVQVRTTTRIAEDGEIISESNHRHVVAPGDDYSQEDEKVQAACQIAHTPEVIAAYREKMEAQSA